MNAIYRNGQNAKGTMMKMTHKTKSAAASDDDTLPSSRDNQREDVSNRNILEDTSCKRRTDVMLIRNTTASIADALLRLGGSSDGSDNSSCDHSRKKRKRSVSLVEESDSCSTDTQSMTTETDASSTGTPKRYRQTPIPTNVCLATSNITSLQDVTTSKNSNLSNSLKDETTLCLLDESKTKNESSHNKNPGSIGCIYDFLHQDFRPLPAAPGFPRDIVPESKPSLHSIHFPHTPSPPNRHMYSTEITEHKDCLIMHSYTVLPRPIPYQMTQIPVPNGF